MTRFGWLVASSIMIAVLGIALLLWGFSRQSSEDEEATDRTPVVNPEALSIYTNGTYGFSFIYPATARIEDSFTEETGFSWRNGVAATGTPIVRIELASGEVRIGASDQDAARTICIESGPAEQTLEPLTIGTTTWQVFSSEQLGTENERRITSYRTQHDDRCFAIEIFEPLNEVAESLAPESPSFIVHNFTFAR